MTEYVYVARRPCACSAVGFVVDGADAFTAETVAQFIVEGRSVARMTVDQARQETYRTRCEHERPAFP